MPYVDTQKAEQLFRHRVMGLLRDKGLLTQERIKLLLSWRRSGFSIDDSVRIPAGEQQMLEPVARYMLRAPVSLSRRRWAHLIRRVLEVDPLVCDRCGGQLRVIGFITEPRVIRRLLDHLKKRNRHNRAPPQQQPVSLMA